MFDYAEAAVEAALAAGARYADARVMHRRHESMGARNGEVEELSQEATVGVGVRALIGSGWGFFATADLTPASARQAGERAAAIARASRIGVRARPGAGADRGSPGQLGQRGPRGPARRCRWPRRATCSPAPPEPCRSTAPTWPRAGYHIWDTEKWFVSQRGPPHRPAHRRVRRADERHRHRRRRDAAPLLPGHPRPVRHARLGAGPRDRPGRQRRPDRRGGPGAAAARPHVPEHDATDADPRRRADGAADPRVGRPRHRARPHPRLGGRLRRHVLARPGPARHAALRLGADEHHRRRDPARAPWAASATTTRARRRSRSTIVRDGTWVGVLSGRDSAAARRPGLGRRGPRPTAAPGCRWCG